MQPIVPARERRGNEGGSPGDSSGAAPLEPVQSGKTFIRFHLPVCCTTARVFQTVAGMASALRVT